MSPRFKQFATPHCHSVASLDTASTPEHFAAWESEHESGALTVTDHGTMGGCRKVYDLATGKKLKGKLTPILGLEAYFRDDNCPVLKSFGIEPQLKYRKPDTGYMISPEEWAKLSKVSKDSYEPYYSTIDYQKYHHLTMHFVDQQAYETAGRILSLADVRAEKHGSERKPLFGWKELEEIGAQNTVFSSSCLIGMVSRHIAFGGRYDIAEAYYQRVRSLVRPGNFFVEVFPHVCDSNWESGVYITFEDGTEEKFWPNRKLLTDRGGEGFYASDLAASWSKSPKGTLVAVMTNREWVELPTPKAIKWVRFSEGPLKNECTVFAPDGDLQKPCNEFVIAMAKKYGDKILVSDDSHFTTPEEKIIQDVKLGQGGQTWRFVTSYHRLTSEEAFARFQQTLGTDEKTFEGWVDNTKEWVDKFKGFKFKDRKSLPTKFYPEDTLTHIFALIQKHGRQDCLRKPEYVERLQAEIDLLHRNGTIDLLPYFMLDEEVCELYQSNGLLTGPGRGSAAGLLLAYLLEITHVDPLQRGLSLDRFLTLDRIQSGKLPDIDQDLPHRDLLVDPEDSSKGWLAERFGDHMCRISTDTTLKLKSAVLDVHRLLSTNRQVPPEVARLAHQFEDPPQGVDNKDFVFGYMNDGDPVAGAAEWDPPLVEYIKKFPAEWEIVTKCLGVPRNRGQHPCAYVVANEPIMNFIPTTSVGGVTVTQPTAAQVESSGGIKMDFLVVKVLRFIQAAIQMVQERSGDTSQPWSTRGNAMTIDSRRVPLHRVVPHHGKYLDIWDLPEDQSVFRAICEGDTESVFQFGTPGARKWMVHFNQVRQIVDGDAHKGLDSIETLSAFTALDRPGPLDASPEGASHNMLVEFARRAKGEAAIGSFPILDRLFPETYGVLTYQEQLQKAFQEVGGTTGIEANNFRVHVSKKQMAEVQADKKIFMRGAVDKIGSVAAEQLWQTMETFGQYGFNKSHAVCYTVIGYACAWLKQHYPLEWWTAVLRHCDKKDLDEKYWKRCGHLIDLPDISLSGDEFVIVNNRIRAPLSLLKGVGEVAHNELVLYRPVKSLEDLLQKIDARRIAQGTTETKLTAKGPKVKVKKARTAIHSGIVNTLILSGAMDSLFPEGTSLFDKLQSYIETEARITGTVYKKGPLAGQPKKKIPSKYLNLNAVQRYQYQKKLLPIHSANIIPAVIGFPGFTMGQNGVDYRHSRVYRAEAIRKTAELQPWPHKHSVTMTAIAFVSKCEKKSYQENTKTRAQLSLDIEGDRYDLVLWPDKETGKLPDDFMDYTGSVVAVSLNKYRGDRPFSIEAVDVIQPALEDDKPEESPDPED